jgi:hypothetical protein
MTSRTTTNAVEDSSTSPVLSPSAWHSSSHRPAARTAPDELSSLFSRNNLDTLRPSWLAGRTPLNARRMVPLGRTHWSTSEGDWLGAAGLDKKTLELATALTDVKSPSGIESSSRQSSGVVPLRRAMG